MNQSIMNLTNSMREMARNRFPDFDPWVTNVLIWDDGDFLIDVKHTDDQGITHVIRHHSSVTLWGLIYLQEIIISTEYCQSKAVEYVPFDGCEDAAGVTTSGVR